MIFQQFFEPVSSTFTYLIAKSRSAEAVIIDPVLEEVDRYLKFLGENNLKLVTAMDTHVHADHKTGLGKLRSITRCMTCYGHKAQTSLVARRLKHGDKITIEGITIDVLETPGHTDDSISYYMEGMVFTGDALFIRGNGRTDFQNGDAGELFDSLNDIIFELPNNTIVWPGHDYKGEHCSTVGVEKVENTRYSGKSRAEFIEIMDNLNLPNPKQMDESVPYNIGISDHLGESLNDEYILSCDEVEALPSYMLIDLRDQDEVNKDGAIANSILIPLRDLEDAIANTEHPINKAQGVIFYCAHGERSTIGLELAIEKGLTNVKHMSGGINVWKSLGKDVM